MAGFLAVKRTNTGVVSHEFFKKGVRIAKINLCFANYFSISALKFLARTV
jgi:hypothetical protein